MNFPESESRPVLAPAGNNKSRPAAENRKQVSKPHRKLEKPQQQQEEIDEATNKVKKSPPSPTPQAPASAAHCFNQKSNFSPNASFSSDASSSDSSHSRASTTDRVRRKSFTPTTMPIRRKQCGSRVEKVAVSDGGDSGSADTKKRCGWVTPNTDPCYAAFHDEEWGFPVHDDKILFELLILSTALAELTWPAILNKRHLFREVFLDFDPIAVSKLNEKKTVSPGSAASTLLSEVKLRAIFENARQMCKIIDEFGSFDKYIWGFVNLKPIVSQFRYPRQVPIKTSKADAISKDLVRRGFRGVGPTVVYSFMQVAGLTNDHLISCFRFHDCIAAADGSDKDSSSLKGKVEEQKPDDTTDLGLARALDDLSLSTE